MFQRQIVTFASPLKIETVAFPIHGLADIDRALASPAPQPNSAVYFLPDITVQAMASQVVEFVRQRRLPTIYTDLTYFKRGGLAFYGVDRTDVYRRAAGSVARLLA